MSANYEAKLADMGITLPTAPAPAAKYVPFVVIGDMVYVSGQISQDAGGCLLYTSPSPRDRTRSRMPSSA